VAGTDLRGGLRIGAGSFECLGYSIQRVIQVHVPVELRHQTTAVLVAELSRDRRRIEA
jgi:hypothetical protein